MRLQRTHIIVAVVLGALGATATALAVGNSATPSARTTTVDSSRATASLPTSATQTSSMDPRLARSFSLLGAPPSASGGVEANPILRQYGGNAALSRTVTVARGTAALTPANGALCLSREVGEAASTSCANTADALTGHLLGVLGGDATGLPDGQLLVSGAVPDGVSSVKLTTKSGGAQDVAVDKNLFSAVVTDPPTAVTWSNGREVAVPFGG